MTQTTFFRSDKDGLILDVRATPKASREGVVGVMPTPDGLALKVAITAPADKGQANAALIAVLAKAFSVAKCEVTLVSGETDRRKRVRVAGNASALTRVAQTWIGK